MDARKSFVERSEKSLRLGMESISKSIEIYFDRNRLTRLKSAQQPPPSLRAKCCLTYLKYKCSNSRKAAARRIPIINKRKADKNCSSAKGSLLFCTSLPGLHVPVIQYLLSRSKSPAILVILPFNEWNTYVKNGQREREKNKVPRLVRREERESNWVVVFREKFHPGISFSSKKKFSNYIFIFERNWKCRGGILFCKLRLLTRFSFFDNENISKLEEQVFEPSFFSILEDYESIREEDLDRNDGDKVYRCPCSRGDVCWTSAGTWNSWRRRGRIRSWRTKIQRSAIGNPRPVPPDSRGPFHRRWTRPSLCRGEMLVRKLRNSKRLDSFSNDDLSSLISILHPSRSINKFLLGLIISKLLNCSLITVWLFSNFLAKNRRWISIEKFDWKLEMKLKEWALNPPTLCINATFHF